jgi:alkylhydroperoxidase/carboxymuconolactone decarboxylase family protein YurZ
MALIDGVRINLGGRDFVVPPLTLGALRALQPQFKELANIGPLPSGEQIDAAAEVIHRALRRNYPDVTLDEILELVDVRAFPDVLAAICGASGLTQREAGDPPQAPTGTASTD